jgi:hypothetical protein
MEKRGGSGQGVLEQWWWDAYMEVIRGMRSDGRGEDIEYLEDLVGPNAGRET